MTDRFRLFQATMALLYLGPLLSGLSLQGWDKVPLFTAIFVLWSVILRPHLWPSRPGDIARPEAVVALLALVATQILLVSLGFTLGRGIGRLLGLEGLLPEYLPAALSFLSVPLARMVWNPDQTETVTGLEAQPLGPAEAQIPAPQDPAQKRLAQLLALPDDAREAEVQARLAAIGQDPLTLRRALEAIPHPSRAGLMALILHATDPDVAEPLSGSAYPAQVFARLGQDAGLLALFAARCARLLQAAPQLAADCPPAAALTEAAATAQEAGAALTQLAALLPETAPAPQEPDA